MIESQTGLALLLGIIGTITGIGCYVPQIIKSYRTKSMGDFHLWFLILIGFNILSWLLFGLVINNILLIIANGIDLCVISFLVVWKLRCHKDPEIECLTLDGEYCFV